MPLEKNPDIELSGGDAEKGECEKLNSSSTELNLPEKGESLADTSQSPKRENVLSRIIGYPIAILTPFFKQHATKITYMMYSLLVLGYLIYFFFALHYDATAATPLVILTLLVLFLVLYETFSQPLYRILEPKLKQCCTLNQVTKGKLRKVWRWFVYFSCLVLIGWILVDIILRNPKQLVSLLGFLLVVLTCIWGSKYPKNINWSPVIWGIGLQVIFGLLILKTNAGFTAIKFIGDQVAAFMKYSEHGSHFVFGPQFRMHYFAFKVLVMVVFFSTVMNMLYYIGIMQWLIGKLAYLTQITLGTSAIESAVAIANIFVGMTEAPLVVRPYLADLTKAEIHSVLTAGLGSIAFSVFAVFVDFGINPVHLLTACVMSAPASLAISRMLFPECEKSKFTSTDSLKLQAGSDRNIVEAAAAGASMSINLVANIAANLLAFLALLAFVNSTLSWFGAFVGINGLSFEMICGYVFMPVAFLMGADWEDCFLVGQLFGVKTFLNEFIAYEDMKPYIKNRLDGVPKYDVNGSLTQMSERSEVIAIHALCGFCNISSLGIIIGGLGALMPTRKKELADMALRALIGGMLTCCMTASIAGLLFSETPMETTTLFMNSTVLPSIATTTTLLNSTRP